MKKLLIILVLAFAISGLGVTVVPEEAVIVAENHILNYSKYNCDDPPILNKTPEILVDPTTHMDIAYLFQITNDGFILVSMDTDLPPVLGFSYENNFPIDYTADPVMAICLRYRRMYEGIPHTDFSVRTANNERWSSYLRDSDVLLESWSTMTVYGPHLDTQWNQGSPYNTYCPYDTSLGQRSVVGCVATAMAQVINYLEWPPSVEFTFDDNFLASSLTPSILVNAPDADIASINYNGSGVHPTSDMIAKISYACGVSVDMDYHPYGSGAYVRPYHLIEHWKIAGSEYMDISDPTFYTELTADMISAQPVLMAISYNDGVRHGHMIVIDGYDDNGTYHHNMGWGGAYDGWYAMPTGMPASYDTVEEMVFNISVPDCNRITVPTDYPSIQQAINAASDGDTIIVNAGTYTGANNTNLNFYGKWIYLKSFGTYTGVTINCENSAIAFEFSSGETFRTVIDGFRIINGFSVGNGGAILVSNFSFPTIRNCYFENNVGSGFGGAVNVLNCRPEWVNIENCVFVNNQSSWQGGAVGVYYSNVKLVNCTIADNIASNYGGAVAMTDYSNLILFNSILWNNAASLTAIDEIYINDFYDASAGSLFVAYTDLDISKCGLGDTDDVINTGGGNIDDDPMFGWAYSSNPSSPCVDRGYSGVIVPMFNSFADATQKDIYEAPRPQGITYDMGAYDYAIGTSVEEDLELPEKFDFEVYPNPFNSTVYIALPDGWNAEIIDASGRVIDILDMSSQWQVPSNIPAGVFLVVAKYNDKRIAKTITYIK